MSQPIRLIRKTVWSDIFLFRIFFWFLSEKISGRKKFLVGFFFGWNNFWLKKFWSEKNVGPKKVQNIVGGNNARKYIIQNEEELR